MATKLTTEINKKYDFRVYTYQNIKFETARWASNKKLEDCIAYSEVMSDKAGKETAVTELITFLKIPESGIITVGDDWNDLKMIQKFNGYIIAGSKPEILSQVIPSHIVSSVAELIDNLLK